MPFFALLLICFASFLFSAGRIIPFESNFTCVCTANRTGLGRILEIEEISFNPKVFITPKPATDASFDAFLKIRTASLGDEMRITSSVRETVTGIAFASLNNRVNLLRLARSYLFRFGLDSLSSALAPSIAI